ncbi:MAG: ABC transporter substrate-binding protein [Anaerolineales bacterium]|nr:ABC transporter substrate-binding protein [Anaerolineales bacterium]
MTRKPIRFWLIGLLSIFILLASGCGGETAVSPTSTPQAVAPIEAATAVSQAIILTDALGNTVELAGPAQRIVSLAPSNTEILFAIGAENQVVGRDSVSDYPEAALAVADIGGGFGELAVETILSLNPDLVLAADITPPEQIKALTDVGLTVYALPNPTDLPGMFANLQTVARLTGREAETAALVADLESRVTAVTEAVASVTAEPLVFYEIDGTDPNAPWTTGPGTFVDTLINMSGGRNVGAVLDGPWAQLSIEELLSQNPDIILLGDYTWGGVTPEDVAARESWNGLTAVQTGAVHTFDDNTVSRPGPRLVDGLEAMARELHPELFQQ